ncbi:MAG: hypothetical protein J5760_03085, partial [Clostridia bacterium]|nr:hypothetical protein [Clostridia bacterium]
MRKSIKRIICILLCVSALALCACDSGIETPGKSEKSAEPAVSADHGSVSKIEPVSGEEGGESEPEIIYESDPAIVFSEIMVHNTVTAADEDGRFLPWIEIKNVSASAAELSEYRIISSAGEYALPPFALAGGGYYLMFFDALPEKDTLTLMHGDAIAGRVDYVSFGADRSFLCENGSETDTPTPGYGGVKAADALSFTEVAPVNKIYPVIKSKAEPFVEIYNYGESDISLGSYYISADPADRYAAKLPEITAKSGEYTVLAASQLGFEIPLYDCT